MRMLKTLNIMSCIGWMKTVRALVSQAGVILLTFEIETQKSFNNDKVANWHRLSSVSIYIIYKYIYICIT